MTLYEIDAQISALMDMEEIVDPDTGEVIPAWQALDALVMEREAKIENVACAVKNREAEIAAIRVEEKRLSDRRKALENRVEGSKAWMIAALTRPDGTEDKVRTGRVSVGVKHNPPSVICEEALLPDIYKVTKTTVTPDKDAIKRAILSGESVPGARLETKRSVMIR